MPIRGSRYSWAPVPDPMSRHPNPANEFAAPKT
jgi:hypothetical protein